MIRWKASSAKASAPLYDLSSLAAADQTVLRARQVLGMKKLPKYILKNSSCHLYIACTDLVDVVPFIDHLKLDDTFSTWFRITKLHVWMILVRCMKEGKPNGELLRNELISRMWEDTTARMDKLGPIKPSQKKAAMRGYYDEFSATLVAMDEGLLSADTVLAAALWRTLFGLNAENIRPQSLELAVGYVRAQLEHLHQTVRSDQLLFQGSTLAWKPFPPLMITTIAS